MTGNIFADLAKAIKGKLTNFKAKLLQYIVMKFRPPTKRSPRENGSKRDPMLQTFMIVVEMNTANTD
jgi:hypothetical protein